jgi:hypothetical protein
MAYPQNPETIILQNKYYPQGFKEIDSYNYYQKNKARILQQTMGRDLMFWIATDINKSIIQRKGKETNYIRLNNSNYDNTVHGRVISIHSSMKRTDDIGIIDIDCEVWDEAKQATIDTYEYVIQKFPIVNSAEIRFTGKSSFHIFCKLNRPLNVDATRFLFEKFLRESPLMRKYTLQQKRELGTANLDLAPNKYRGAYITLHSLSTWGLRCIIIDHGDILKFDPYHATVKV